MKRQDVYVERFIQKHLILTDWENLSNDIVLLVKHRHPDYEQEFIFAISAVEPTKTFLPENVVWFCFNPSSPYYKKALRRIGENPSADFEHTWQELFHWEELWQTQVFSKENLEELGVDLPPLATTTHYGIVKLHAEEESSTVIVTSDPRLSDARKPLKHGHDETPITVFEPNIKIEDAELPFAGKALVKRNGSFHWDFLKEDMVDLDE
jgi:hypothetical protein